MPLLNRPINVGLVSKKYFPAKRMNDNIDYIDVESLPVFLPQTEELLGILKTLKVDEVKKMLGCNDQIAQIAYLNYQMMDLKKDTVPALLAYEGITIFI